MAYLSLALLGSFQVTLAGMPVEGFKSNKVWALLAYLAVQEEAHQQLMRLLALSGRRSAALAQFDTCRHLLTQELGVEPGSETIALYEQIRTGKLTGDIEASWAAGAISAAHANRLWQSLPQAVQALLEDGPDLLETFIPGAALLARVETHSAGV